MPTVSRLARPSYVFDDKATSSMGAAFDKAVVCLGGSPNVLIRETIAKCIIDLASRGECDPEALAQGALAKLCRHLPFHGQPRSPSRFLVLSAGVTRRGLNLLNHQSDIPTG
jgi:hypothetical protein